MNSRIKNPVGVFENQCSYLITKGKTGKNSFKKKSGGNYNGSLKLLPDGKVVLVPSWLE